MLQGARSAFTPTARSPTCTATWFTTIPSAWKAAMASSVPTTSRRMARRAARRPIRSFERDGNSCAGRCSRRAGAVHGFYANEIGMEIYGDRSRIIANDIHHNDIGVQGTRIIGPENWESLLDNRIHHNGIGVRTTVRRRSPLQPHRPQWRWRRDHRGRLRPSQPDRPQHGRREGSSMVQISRAWRKMALFRTYLVRRSSLQQHIYATSGNGMRLDGFIRDVLLRNNS